MEMTNKDVLLGVNELEVSFFTHAGEVKAVRKVSYDLKYGEGNWATNIDYSKITE